MTGIYLKCDKCGATVGGEEADKVSPTGLNKFAQNALRAYARGLGWTGSMRAEPFSNNDDRCPTCGPVEKEP